MIKKILLILAIAAALNGCGGNSASETPTGVNPGVASRVELTATSYVNQTNGYCYLKTKVIDGNGLPIPNTAVIFTNLSLTGVLDHTTAMTGANGIATATLYSTTEGFATIQSEVDTGTEQIRDKKTVFFTSFDIAFPTPPTPTTPADLSSLTLTSDNYTLFETPTDTDANITATVTGSNGLPMFDSTVTFGADSPAVSFPFGSNLTAPVVHTNSAGVATVLARVSPTALTTSDTTVNITASAVTDTKTIPGILTLFLKPVTINSITVTADPSTVISAGTSAISARVSTTAGTPPPSGTFVNFSTSAGSITPFSATDPTGIATATLTAPTIPTGTQTLTVSATAAGTSGSATVTVTAVGGALNVIPVTQTMPLPILVGQTAHYTIIGGTPPYSVFSDTPSVAQASITGSTLTAMIASVPAASQIVTFSIYDAVGATVNATLKLNITGGGGGGTGVTITPSTATTIGLTGTNTDAISFLISGGTGSYNCQATPQPNAAGILDPGIVNPVTNSITVDPNAVPVQTIVTITCTDTSGASATAVLTVNPIPFSITINPINVIGLGAGSTADPVTVTVNGGTGPYIVTSSNPALTPNGTWSSATLPFTYTIYPNNVGTTTPVTLTVVDNLGDTAKANLTIFPQAAGIVISVNKPSVIGLPNPDGNPTDDVTFTVTGGVAPYVISSGNAADPLCNNSFFAPTGPWTIAASGGTVTIDPGRPNNAGNPIICTLTATDNIGAIATTAFTVYP